jgi:lipid II:glycine glycyltransferase (peptidoglycan interpeptide bridge formation enzyme)
LIENPVYGVYCFKKDFGGKLVTYLLGEKILLSGRAKIFKYIMQNRKIVRTVFQPNNNL